MRRSRILPLLLALLMVVMAFPTGIVSAKEQARHVSLKQESELALNKVTGELAAAFRANDYVHVLIKFKEQADTQLAAELAQRKAQLQGKTASRKEAVRSAVVDALQETATASQRAVLELLAKEQVKGKVKEIDSYFIVNMVHVLTTKDVVEKIALQPEVEKIMPSAWIAVEKPTRLSEEILADGPGRQWNIENVGAYEVWDTYGLDGTGVVVGIIDTGTYYQHDALVKKWRGYSAPGIYNPVYNWFDAIDGREMPYDEEAICHGTHVMGTILGGDTETNNLIGVAPGAKWISAKAFDEDGGWDHWILEAAEYMLAPLDEFGNPNPAMAPDIINNSWGGGPGLDEWFRPMVNAWRAAEILPVFSAGNTYGGSSPGSVSVPSNYPESIAVAAIDINNLRGNFSNQGPGPYADLKPDISAPGVNIRSSVIGGGYENGWDGTSMAAPHVAGTAALMLQANTSLTVDTIEDILYNTADPLVDTQYPASPNYGYGRGIINAVSAVKIATEGYGTIYGQVLAAGVDTEQPVIEHTPVDSLLNGMDLVLTARATDDIAVVAVEIWLKPVGQSDWQTFTMDRYSGDHRDGLYQGTIPGAYITEPGITYKIVVVDWADNLVATTDQYVSIDFGVAPGVTWDFEEYPLGWEMDGDWQWGEPINGQKPFSGTKVVATNLDSNYSPDSESYLVSPPLDLRNITEASLRAKHWYNLETNYDFGYVIVTEDFITGDILAEFTGCNGDWQDMVVNLNPYCGSEEPVYVVFALATDYSICWEGWYLDSIYFQGIDEDAPTPPTNMKALEGVTGICLSWSPAPEADVAGYNIYRAETSGGPYASIGSTNALTFTDRFITEGKKYFYVARAVDFSGNESVNSHEASCVAPVINVVFCTDFETDDGGFTTGGTNNSWQWGIPSSGPGGSESGTKLWATNLTGDYFTDSDCWLESPSIDLTGYPGALLEISHWYKTETYWDICNLEISSDGGLNWVVLNQYDGTSYGWQTSGISLDNYLGKTVKIRFRLSSDYSVNDSGWYIDLFNVIALSNNTGSLAASNNESAVLPRTYRFSRSRMNSAESAVAGTNKLVPQSGGGIPVDAKITVVETGKTVRTNPATGMYRIVLPGLPDGTTWTLRFEAYGYDTVELPFFVAAGEEINVDAFMESIPRGGVDGCVVSSIDGEAIPNAKISLLEDSMVPQVISNEQGQFLLENIPQGDYTLRVTAAGYMPAQLPLTIIGNEMTVAIVRLDSFTGTEEEIAYDDGEVNDGVAFYEGGNGFGVRFTPNRFAQIAGANVYLWGDDWPDPGDNKFSVAVFDSLPNGEVGEMVTTPFVVEGTRGDWNYIDLSHFSYFTDRDFYIFYIQVGDLPNCPGLGFDASEWAGRTYEMYNGEFNLLEDYGNAMIRAHVLYSSSVARLAGRNRYETAVKVSKDGWATSESVVLARGDQYADALAGATLAYSLDAPILLTNPTKLTEVTATEIERLGASKVYILGGDGAVGANVVNALKAMGLTTERISGSNRYKTAAKISEIVAPTGTDRVILTSGMDFPDALSAGAYAARHGIPILLTRGDRLSPEAEAAIEKLNATTTILIGGEAVLSRVIEGAVPGAVRIVGNNRYGTSVKVAEYFSPGSSKIYVATGLQFADALSGAVLAAKNDSGILLVGKTVPSSVGNYLFNAGFTEIVIFGGEGAISEDLADQLKQSLFN